MHNLQSWLFVILTIAIAAGCPGEQVKENSAQNKQDFEKERLKLLTQIDRNNYSSEKKYRITYSELLKKYHKLAIENPDSALYQYLYGLLLVDKNKKLRQFTRCLQIQPDNFWCLIGRGLLYVEWGVTNFAEKDLKKARKLRPNRLEPILGLAALYVRRRRYTEAEELYKKVLSKEPENIEALEGLADLYYLLGQRDKAIQYYKKVVSINPKKFEAWKSLSELYKKQKNYAAMAEALEKAIALRPQYKLKVTLADIYERHLNNKKRALELYEDASKSRRAHFNTFFRIGVLKSEFKDWEGAKEAFTKALEYKDDHAETYYRLGLIYLRHFNDPKKAEDYLWKAIRYDNKNIDIRLALAETLEKNKDYAKALNQYQEILRLTPDNPKVIEKLKKLTSQLNLPYTEYRGNTVGKVFLKARKFIHKCYQKRVKQLKKKKLKGKVHVILVIAQDGKVEEVNINLMKSSLKDPIVNTCIKWSFFKAIFPVKKRARVTITLPFPLF